MDKIYHTTSVEETTAVAAELLHDVIFGSKWTRFLTLSGDLGAGKTTFTQGLLGALGAVGPFTSPTFAVIKLYDLADGSVGRANGIERVYHIDAYRMTDRDMVELGWHEIIADPRALVIVEWPEKVASILPRQRTDLALEAISVTDRQITVHG